MKLYDAYQPKSLRALTEELGQPLTPEQQAKKLDSLLKPRKPLKPMPKDWLKR